MGGIIRGEMFKDQCGCLNKKSAEYGENSSKVKIFFCKGELFNIPAMRERRSESKRRTRSLR